jgi:two-component system response regulator PilR (NtrC family)
LTLGGLARYDLVTAFGHNGQSATQDATLQEFQHLHDAFGEQNENETTSLLGHKLPRLVLVEDDSTFLKALELYLKKQFALTVCSYNNPNSFLNDHSAGVFDDVPICLITDISFNQGKTDGLILIDLLKEKNARFTCIVMTGFGSIETAIAATKKGAFKYFTKPFDLEDLTETIVNACEKELGIKREQLHSLGEEEKKKTLKSFFQKRFQLEAPTPEDFYYGMIGRSAKMRALFDKIQLVASSNSTILIQGPSGTGKELIANAIHHLSNRSDHKMVSVNCGAIPSELLESELFGHMKGSFTGALSDRKGRFEMAHGGTIFLDEIGDMPLLLQVKLLRVLQNRTVEPVGSNKSVDVNVRVVTATHKDLELLVQNGDFREDLFYRLNVIPLKVPALMERREDIPLLITHFLQKFSSADGRNTIEFDQEALDALISYDWPGNVRELENLIERLVILKGGHVIRTGDLPTKILQSQSQNAYYEDIVKLPENGFDLKEFLEKVEDSIIHQALERTGGNKNQASKLLHMNRTTLIEKLKKRGNFLN